MSLTHLRPRTAGEILDGAFVLYRRHFVVLVAAALLPSVPSMAYRMVAAGGVSPGAQSVLVVYDTAVTILLWGALVGLCSSAVTGEPVSLGAAYLHAREHFWRLLGISFVSGFWILLGLVLFVVPGVVAFVFLFFSSHVAMIEDAGVLRSVERSWELSRLNRRRVTGVAFVTGVIFILPSLLLGAGMVMVGEEAPWVVGMSGLLEILLVSLMYPFLAASATLLYYDCRVRTEALDLQAATERLAALS